MNERIKKLASQCWDRRLDGIHFDVDMFAELIVRECIAIVEQSSYRQALAQPEQKREWVGLTENEIEEIARWSDKNAAPWYLEYAKGIEAKLKEKNT